METFSYLKLYNLGGDTNILTIWNERFLNLLKDIMISVFCN